MTESIIKIKYKMVLFGSEGVGKTSLIHRFVNDKFDADYTTTIGYNIYEKIINLDRYNISLIIYDFGGQEQFKSIRRRFSQGTDIAFLVYDITDKESFNDLSKWKFELSDVSNNATFIIVGNKKDLEEERQVVKKLDKDLIEKLDAINFFETSAKTGENVEDAFILLVKETLKRNQ
ncbi:MAG: GTP-binding protein [Candidatus Lokiarchaeota archaeon]|nr:GTP-binding protein [Candidatus Lokiarchaeota archaeon]